MSDLAKIYLDSGERISPELRVKIAEHIMCMIREERERCADIAAACPNGWEPFFIAVRIRAQYIGSRSDPRGPGYTSPNSTS